VTRIGVISDTHGLLRPAALRALTGVDAARPLAHRHHRDTRYL